MGYSPAVVRQRTLAFSAFFAGVVLITATLVVHAQGAPAPQGPAGQPAGAPGRGAPPPPAPQPGHPSGQLVIWGDSALFDGRQNPENCILLSRFKRGMRMGFRMTAIDGGSGEVENTAIITGHITYNSKTKGRQTVDFSMRWRGAAGPNAPAPAGYLRVPLELWTGFWIVPEDAETGMISYTMTAVDRFGRKASFRPFPDIGSQIYIVD
jgi:hypothetical protein